MIQVPATSHRMKGKLKGATDVWEIPAINNMAKERLGYPTQKPLALMRQVIKASSREDDIVFDPFCGCATTLVAADDLGRQWAGIDISAKAAELVVHRIQERQGLFRDITHRTDIPQRTDLGKLPASGSLENRHHLYGVQGGDCAGCGEHFKIHHLEVDHIIARSKGGTDHLDNLQLLCGHCNRVKGNRGMEYLRSKLRLAA
ncbi:MAG: DNA methyltransferase [bacterium]|nr:HNH endonuclease [Acidimicrobiia bacterium]MCY4648965.1 DNA methyltransferase [bacterium]